MDIKQIQELVKLVTKSGISELSVKEGDFEVAIKTGGVVQLPMQQYQTMMPAMTAAPTAETVSSTTAAAAAQVANNANTFTFKSPMIGTFYRKPSPDKEVFVKVGDSIQKGDVLCIIEAMKLFNEIEYDGESGKIVKILTDDLSPVEYDQALFLIEKE